MTRKDWSKVKWHPKGKIDRNTTFDMRCKMSFKARIKKIAIERGMSQADVVRLAIERFDEYRKVEQ
jgi:hypothetical protein